MYCIFCFMGVFKRFAAVEKPKKLYFCVILPNECIQPAFLRIGLFIETVRLNLRTPGVNIGRGSFPEPSRAREQRRDIYFSSHIIRRYRPGKRLAWRRFVSGLLVCIRFILPTMGACLRLWPGLDGYRGSITLHRNNRENMCKQFGRHSVQQCSVGCKYLFLCCSDGEPTTRGSDTVPRRFFKWPTRWFL